jgi:hypothetical protein
MAKSNKQIIEKEVIELQKLISWCEYYTAIGNPIEANKTQKEITLAEWDKIVNEVIIDKAT